MSVVIIFYTVYQLTETYHDSSYGAPKVTFHPSVVWEAEGFATEVLIQGLHYTNVQMGLTNSRISCKGDAICGISDFENTNRVRTLFQFFF